MGRTLYVSPFKGNWKVHWEKDTSGTLFTRKEDAVKAARKLVADLPAGQVSQIIVQREDGTFQTEWTYGQDPYPPRG